jgi:amidohydrolase
MLDAEAWASTGTLIEDLVHEVVAPYGVSAQVEHVRGVPPVVNDDAVVATLRAAAAAALDPGAAVPTRQSLGGEDFGWYLTGASGASGALVRLGTRTPGGPTYELHQGDLVVADRAVLVAARLLAAACAVGGPTGTRK